MHTPSCFFLAMAFGFAGSAAFAADNCEPIRQGIEANIASKGLSGFSVTVVDISADAAGEEVGRCGNGTRKIMYVREGAVPAAAVQPAAPSVSAPAQPARSSKGQPILTECKDGTVSMGGNCKP